MARFLIVTLPITGHFSPVVPIARRLVERGHEVWWYAGGRFRQRVEATGARYVPMGEGHDYDDRDLDAAFPGRAGLSDLGQVKFDMEHLFIDDAFLQLRDLQRFTVETPVDLVVADLASGGPVLLHELGGPPFASIGVTALTVASRDTAPFGSKLMPSTSPLGRLRNRLLYVVVNRVLFGNLGTYYNQRRQEIGLPPYNGPAYQAFNSAYLLIEPTVPEFEYPRGDLSPAIRFVGPLLPDAPPDVALPDWWHELEGRTVVHVTQGTWATTPEQLIIPALQALKDEDLLVVAAAPGRPVPPDQIPANGRVAGFLPYREFLPHVDVMLTNGGYGGVNFALANGVPLIVAGTTEDKPEIANRVAWSGVGINLKTSRPSQEQIRNAVREVLGSSRYRDRARGMQASMERHDGPTESAVLLEQLVASRQEAAIVNAVTS